VGTHVPSASVFMSLLEESLRGLLVSVVVSLKPACHSKVVHKERMLVDVLENAELALVERQLESVLEVVMRVQALLSFFTLVGYRQHRHRIDVWKGPEDVTNIGPVESFQVFLLPIQLVEGQVLDTLRMVQLISKSWQHTRVHSLLLLANVILAIFVARV